MDDPNDETPTIDVERLWNRLRKNVDELRVLNASLVRASAPPMLIGAIEAARHALEQAMDETRSIYN